MYVLFRLMTLNVLKHRQMCSVIWRDFNCFVIT